MVGLESSDSRVATRRSLANGRSTDRRLFRVAEFESCAWCLGRRNPS